MSRCSHAKQFLRNPLIHPTLKTELTLAIEATEFTEATLATEVADTIEKNPKIAPTAAKLQTDPTAPTLKNE